MYVYIYTQLFYMYAKLFLICFNNGFFTNQVTNILRSGPFCKSGHICQYNQYLYQYTLIW